MKIAVIGSSGNIGKDTVKKAREVGIEIIKNNFTLLTGATTGASYEAAKAAKEEDGLVIGISPARNKKEHKEHYHLPTDAFNEIIYTGFGYRGRNVILVRNADAVIMISGKSGTLNEFTIAFADKKPIGILKGTGGVTEIIEKISETCNKTNEKKFVVYESNPKKLVKKVIALL